MTRSDHTYKYNKVKGEGLPDALGQGGGKVFEQQPHIGHVMPYRELSSSLESSSIYFIER